MKLKKLLKHAFSAGSEPLTDDEKKLLDNLIKKVRSSPLKSAAAVFIESIRPLDYIGSQTVVALKPFIEFAVPKEKIDQVISILSKRNGLDYLIKGLNDGESNTRN
ncbi:MAG: hypothetical protein HY606_05735 [Planctomycetes bacterium]|nr:hypothetical protein [Planctomycetota bacterium]